MSSRLFTVEEANKLIPRLEMLMERLQRTARELRDAVSHVANDRVRTTADAVREHPELRPHVETMERTLGEIEELGGQFKGLDLGLVDFLGEVDGQPALLCWQYGEKAIEFWHPVDEGFAARRALGASAGPQLQ
jgi:hypothetical protein